jgi:hypothetical protein
MGTDVSIDSDIRLIALVLAIGMLVAHGFGRRVGARLGKDARAKPSKFTDASTALLGLLLAFSFGMSISKHDQRRLAVVADSNAIGDFYTCATLLKEPTRTKLQAVIREYTEQRLDLTRGKMSSDKLETALAKFNQLHGQMTDLVAEALSNATPIAVPLTNTLNAVTSNQAARLAAYRDRLPVNILLLLFVSAILTAFLDGRDQGLGGSFDRAGMLCFVTLVSLAVYVTLDLNRPEAGWIRISQEPLQRLLSTM